MDDYETDLRKEREMKDQFMARHPESPFIIGDASGFHGLRYFPIDPNLKLAAVLERNDRPAEAVLRTNRDGQLTCRYIGDMRFALEGQEFRLRVFHAGEQVGPSVFIPFRDATCGDESYAPGRYLILKLSEDDRYTLDFNLAFNPYCAYTDRFECGFPPPENDLPVAIRAGEMSWTSEGIAALRPEEERRARRPRPTPATTKARPAESASRRVAPISPARSRPSRRGRPGRRSKG